MSPILLIAVPLFFAFSVPLWGIISKKIEKFIPFISLSITTAIAFYFVPIAIKKPIIVVTGGFLPPFGINLTVGALGIFLAVLIQVVGVLVSIFIINYRNPEPGEKYYMLFLLLIVGVTGMVLTGDIFNLFVFLEITGISSYALTAVKKKRGSVEGAFKYLLLGSLGSTLVLLGIALIYGSLGTLNMADIAEHIGHMDKRVLLTAALLFITGFGVEAEIFPVNGWVPDAYEGAPIPVIAIFSSAVAKAGLYALARILYTLMGAPGLIHLLLVLGILTLLIGEFAALRQNDLRRLLAYSSIGQMGLIVLAFGVGTLGALSAGLFQILNHSIGKTLLFLGLGIMITQSGSSKLDALSGFGKGMPITTLFFTVGVLSLMGLPPLSGFWSKLWIILSVIDAKYVLLASLIFIGAIIEAAYFLRVLKVLYLGSYEGPRPRGNFLGGLVMASLVVILIVFGLYPHLITRFLVPAAQELISRTNYIGNVLGGL